MSKNVFILCLVIIVILGGVILFLQSNPAINNAETTPAPSIAQSPNPTIKILSVTPASTSGATNDEQPIVTVPRPSAQVTSPLTVLGSVPPGWMFEGVFPVKLLDAEKNVIAKGQGKEIKPGSWSSGNAVPFRVTIEFTTTAASGFVVLEKDNPSGLPENAATHEIPVKF